MHSISFELHARVLKFHTWIPHEKRVDTYFFFLSGFCPLLSYEKIWMESCQQVISKTIEARALKIEE